jgi:predicted DNA-binding ArsR family transcriptional regulator
MNQVVNNGRQLKLPSFGSNGMSQERAELADWQWRAPQTGQEPDHLFRLTYGKVYDEAR